MPRYAIDVKEVTWHRFEIDTDLTDPEEIEQFFYEMDPEDQQASLLFSDSQEWAIETVEPRFEPSQER